MADRKTSRAAKVIREICNRRRNSDIRADDREVQEAFDALLLEAAKDTERLAFVLAVLQVRGVDGLFDLIWKPFNAFDRHAIDSARAVLDVDMLGVPVTSRITRDPAFGEMDAAWLDPPPDK